MFLERMHNFLNETHINIESKVMDLESKNTWLSQGKTVCQLKIVGIRTGCAGIAGIAALTAVVTLPLLVLAFTIALAKDKLAKTPMIDLREIESQDTHNNSWEHQVLLMGLVLPHVSWKAGKIALNKKNKVGIIMHAMKEFRKYYPLYEAQVKNSKI
jgi:hypothetical protein